MYKINALTLSGQLPVDSILNKEMYKINKKEKFQLKLLLPKTQIEDFT